MGILFIPGIWSGVREHAGLGHRRSTRLQHLGAFRDPLSIARHHRRRVGQEDADPRSKEVRLGGWRRQGQGRNALVKSPATFSLLPKNLRNRRKQQKLKIQIFFFSPLSIFLCKLWNKCVWGYNGVCLVWCLRLLHKSKLISCQF